MGSIELSHLGKLIKVPAGRLIRHVQQPITLLDTWGSMVQTGARLRRMDAVAAITTQVPLPHWRVAQVSCNPSFWVSIRARYVEGHDTVNDEHAGIGQKGRIGATFSRPGNMADDERC